MLVLTLDTSTPAVTAGVVRVAGPHELVAALEAGRPAEPVAVLAEAVHVDAFAHAEVLIPQARQALAQANHTLAELDGIVVGLGPGPFTGLRVGIVTAAALGDGLDLPVHGVPSHDAVAWSIAPPGRPAGADFLVATDARRREVYLSAYTAAGRRTDGPRVLAPAVVAEELDADPIARAVTGAGAHLIPGVRPALTPVLPLSAGLAGCAAPALLTGAVPGPLTPLYLRRPDAVPPRPRTVTST